MKKIVQRESTAEESLSGRLVQKAVAYINGHALEGIGVRDVVKHLKCSRRLADLRFRELQGRSILNAITERRLDEVKRLLAGTRDKMDVIASACGYRNPTYLKNLFKKQFEMSMRDFRASARGTMAEAHHLHPSRPALLQQHRHQSALHATSIPRHPSKNISGDTFRYRR